MSLPFLNTVPGYDEELRNSVLFERGLHATSICGAVGAAVAVAMLQGAGRGGGSPPPPPPRPPGRPRAEPPEARARRASGSHAAVSGRSTVAAALLGGGPGVSHEDFTDAAAGDPRRLALAALVRCVEDERCSASFPRAFPAVLRVTTRTGEELESRVEVNRGGPGNPRSDEELARKLHDNAVGALPEGARGRARGPIAPP